ncbi:hypothetical protein [Parvibaculum sp.]|uniref:hypothetical protein n=1 Tax=Parvibaculum sp. TaxID=2024848 RepID=UPI00320D9A3E
MYAIDVAALQPLVNELVLATLTALASVVVARACAFLKAKRDGELGQILDKTLGMGIAFAMSKLKAAEDGHATVSVKSEVVAEAANYALLHVPQTVKALGLDGEHLGRMIEARLGVAEGGAQA